MKPTLAVCPKAAVRSQIRTNRKSVFGPNLSKNGFRDQNFENLTPDRKSALPRHHVC